MRYIFIGTVIIKRTINCFLPLTRSLVSQKSNENHDVETSRFSMTNVVKKMATSVVGYANCKAT